MNASSPTKRSTSSSIDSMRKSPATEPTEVDHVTVETRS